MRLLHLGAVVLPVLGVSAFQNTSPFFYFSTSGFDDSHAALPQLSTSSAVSHKIQYHVSLCASDAYIIVSQPEVSALDFSSSKASPRLRRAMQHDGDVKSSFQVVNVKGDLDLEELQSVMKERCNAASMHVDASTGTFETIADMKPRVIRVDFSPLPSSQPERAAQLSQNDAFLSSIIDLLPSTKYTVLYTTTPPASSAPSELKRRTIHQSDSQAKSHSRSRSLHHPDLDLETMDTATNVTLIDGPLFRRYQFFTPGLFTGLVAAIPLLMILYVAIAGLASLKVSYGAFDKEMGPAAHAKGKVQ